jgi:hypothetical protein
MSRIFRYSLKLTVTQTIEMPLSYKLLSVAPGRTDDYTIDLWAQVPEQAPMVPVTIEIVGTGHPMPKAVLYFVGTAVMPDGLVWHVFERPDPMSVKT